MDRELGIAIAGIIACMGLLWYVGVKAEHICSIKPYSTVDLFAPEMSARCKSLGYAENHRR